MQQVRITDVVDVQAIVNEALGITAADDLTHDGRVDVSDVQIVVNSAIGKGCSAS